MTTETHSPNEVSFVPANTSYRTARLLPRLDAMHRRDYRQGDGDYAFVPRPGSEDFKKCPSKGLC